MVLLPRACSPSAPHVITLVTDTLTSILHGARHSSRMRQRQVTVERHVHGRPIVRHKPDLRLHSTGESTFCQCTVLCRPRLSFAPSGTLALTAFCLNSNRTDRQVWNYTRARYRHEYARHSSVTDTRSYRSCDNGLWKINVLLTRGLPNRATTDCLLLLTSTLPRMSCRCQTAPKDWVKSQTRPYINQHLRRTGICEIPRSQPT